MTDKLPASPRTPGNLNVSQPDRQVMPGAFSRLRFFAFLFAACAALVVPPALAEAMPAMRERLVFAGPAASVTNPLIHMLESGALDDLARSTEFILWNNPDQLRALVIQGQVDFIAVPTNVACTTGVSRSPFSTFPPGAPCGWSRARRA